MPRLVIKMAFMCAVAFGLLLSCLTNLEELPGDFPQDIAMSTEGAADTSSLRHQMVYMVEVSRVLHQIAASPQLAGKYAEAGDGTALLVAQTARSTMVENDTNSRPAEGQCEADIFDKMLHARWAGSITSSPPFDSTVACSAESKYAEGLWQAATNGYMDAVVRDGVDAVSRTLKWAEQLQGEERTVEANVVKVLAKAVAFSFSNIVQVPVRYRAMKHRQSRPHEVVLATIVSSVDGAGHWLLDTVHSVDGTKVLATLGEASSHVVRWGKRWSGMGYTSTVTAISSASNALVAATNYITSKNFGSRLFAWSKTLDEAAGSIAEREGSEGKSLADKFMRCTKVPGGPEPAPDSTEAQLLFGAWV